MIYLVLLRHFSKHLFIKILKAFQRGMVNPNTVYINLHLQTLYHGEGGELSEVLHVSKR